MTLAPDGRCLSAGGWLPETPEDSAAVRLYDFASRRLIALLSQADVVLTFSFSSDGKRLISGGADASAIIWDLEGQNLLHCL